MTQQKISDEDKFRRIERIKQQRARTEALQKEKYDTPSGRKFDKSVRIAFFIQFFFSVIGLFYFPFSSVSTVKSYSPFTYSRASLKDVNLVDGQELTLCSTRLKTSLIREGDIVYVERNFFGKKEALTVKKSNKTYFFKAKTNWFALHIILAIVAIISSRITKANNLRAKRGISTGLAVMILLYFLI